MTRVVPPASFPDPSPRPAGPTSPTIRGDFTGTAALTRDLAHAHFYVHDLVGLEVFAAALLLVVFWEGGERRGEI